jgi:hypothetical protein
MTDELLTLGEVARLLKITTKKVHELTRERSQKRSRHPLPVVKIHAKLIRVRREDFDAWIAKMAGVEQNQSGEIRSKNTVPSRKSDLQRVREILRSER